MVLELAHSREQLRVCYVGAHPIQRELTAHAAPGPTETARRLELPVAGGLAGQVGRALRVRGVN